MKRLLLFLGAGLLATVLFFLLGALFSGGGHSLIAINIFFPYAGLVVPSVKDTRWQFVPMTLLLTQFPVYALLIAYSSRRRNLVVTLIPLVHTVAAIMAVQVYESSKPRYGVLLPTSATEQLVGPERRERVSHQTSCGED